MSDYLTMAELDHKTLKEIYTYAKEFKIPYYSQMNKKELSLAVIRAQAEKQGFFYMLSSFTKRKKLTFTHCVMLIITTTNLYKFIYIIERLFLKSNEF